MGRTRQGVTVAISPAAHALHRPVARHQGLKVGSGVLTALVGMAHQPSGWLTHGQGAAERFADQVFGHGFAHVPADHLEGVAGEPGDQVQPPAALFRQVGDIALPGTAHPHLVRGRGGRLARQQIRGGSHTGGGIGGAGHKRARLPGRTRLGRASPRQSHLQDHHL